MTAKALAFDLSRAPAAVFFAEDPPLPFFVFDAARVADGAAADFSPHLCGDDTYYGSMRIDGRDDFSIRWTVTGPAKDGSITQHFHRRRAASTHDAAEC
mmetsp:Transcript_15588/g.47126  ORF Transcript_15588/g.47126 Transcript_15588/m.47126 type:complete len:99 (+) Transcript_15588:94-390(+)